MAGKTNANIGFEKQLWDARSVLLSVYGEKLGNEAYSAMKNAREGASYRKSGGPLVCAVSKDKAEEIREKEIAIGMM